MIDAADSIQLMERCCHAIQTEMQQLFDIQRKSTQVTAPVAKTDDKREKSYAIAAAIKLLVDAPQQVEYHRQISIRQIKEKELIILFT